MSLAGAVVLPTSHATRNLLHSARPKGANPNRIGRADNLRSVRGLSPELPQQSTGYPPARMPRRQVPCLRVLPTRPTRVDPQSRSLLGSAVGPRVRGPAPSCRRKGGSPRPSALLFPARPIASHPTYAHQPSLCSHPTRPLQLRCSLPFRAQIPCLQPLLAVLNAPAALTPTASPLRDTSAAPVTPGRADPMPPGGLRPVRPADPPRDRHQGLHTTCSVTAAEISLAALPHLVYRPPAPDAGRSCPSCPVPIPASPPLLHYCPRVPTLRRDFLLRLGSCTPGERGPEQRTPLPA